MSPLENSFTKPDEDSIQERKNRLLYLFNFLKKIGIEDIIKDPEKKKEFIQNLSFDEFKDILLRLNGVLRDTPTSKRNFNAELEENQKAVKITQGDETTYMPPPNRIKMELLEDAFNALKRMISQNRVRDGSLMVGCAINAIHPFENGNGRTARSISMLLASSKGKYLASEVNPALMQPFIEGHLHDKVYKVESFKYKGFDTAEIVFPESMSEDDKFDFLLAVSNEIETLVTACSIFAKEKGDDLKKSFLDPDTKVLAIKKFFSKYENEISDILDTYFEFKEVYVHTLIDIFENPTKYYLKDSKTFFDKLPDDEKNKYAKSTLKDLFIKIDEKSSKSGKEFSLDYLIKETEK